LRFSVCDIRVPQPRLTELKLNGSRVRVVKAIKTTHGLHTKGTFTVKVKVHPFRVHSIFLAKRQCDPNPPNRSKISAVSCFG